MKHTPTFRTRYENGYPQAANFVQLDSSEITSKLKLALKEEGFAGIYAEAKRYIALLHTEPRLNCLMRHTFESIARVAALAPGHLQASRSLELPSTEDLSMSLLESHFYMINQMNSLDKLALPIQISGVPILCQDVPPIPVP